MNVIFYTVQQVAKEIGGVERVISAMYDSLTKMGYNITIIYFRDSKTIYKSTISNQIKIPYDTREPLRTKSVLYNIMSQGNFKIALNFAATFNKVSTPLAEVCVAVGIPMISIYHNTLDWPLWAYKQVRPFMFNALSRSILHRLYGIIQKNPFFKNARYISRMSHASVVLSNSYISQFKKYIDSSPRNLLAIYNPLAMITSESDSDFNTKKNIVLFVGRLDDQKNLRSLLRIWNKVHNNNWELEIVGSGSAEYSLKEYARDLGLPTSIFKGATDHPEEYYKRAKIFAMTSSFEGFPMTLIECQAYGCVPIIFDSYPAASEIVHGNNGILINRFDESSFCNELSSLMINEEKLKKYSIESVKWAKKFDINLISKQWEILINKIVNNS